MAELSLYNPEVRITAFNPLVREMLIKVLRHRAVSRDLRLSLGISPHGDPGNQNIDRHERGKHVADNLSRPHRDFLNP